MPKRWVVEIEESPSQHHGSARRASEQAHKGIGAVMLLDSASLYYRAFYGVPDRRSNPEEPANNAIRGFLDMLASLIVAYRPACVVACWDDDWRPAFRVAAIECYKAHRLLPGSTSAEDTPPELAPQVPVIAEILAAIGLARVGAPGFEADDVIATLSRRFSAEGEQVDIVSGDRDLFQLVDDAGGVRVLYTAKGGVREAQPVDQSYLRESYGVDTGTAYADLAILRGDPSDGLPGVPGIGAKTAAGLLHDYDDLAGIRAAAQAGDPGISAIRRQRLLEASDYLDCAPMVVRLVTDIDTDCLPRVAAQLPTRVANASGLARLAGQYGVTAAVTRLLAALRIGSEAE